MTLIDLIFVLRMTSFHLFRITAIGYKVLAKYKISEVKLLLMHDL